MKTRPQVALVVPSFVKPGREAQSSWLLKQFFNSLSEVEQGVDVVIVDDGSPGLSREFYKEFPCHVIWRDTNKGFSRSVNNGILWALLDSPDLIFVMNSDLEFMEPFVDRAMEVFKAYPETYIWGPRLVWPDGRIQSAGFDFNSQGNCTHYFREQHSDPNDNSEKSRAVQGVTGAFMALNPKHIEKVGLFSEDYRLAYEDVELCLRTWERGSWVIYDGQVDCIHLEGATRGSGLTETELNSQLQFKKDLEKYSIPKIKLRIAMATQAIHT